MVQEAHFAFDQYGCSQCIYLEQEIWHTKNVTFSLSRIHCELPHNYSIGKCHLSKKRPHTPIDNTETRLNGKHFIKKFEHLPNSKRKAPARRCKVCNFSREQLAHYRCEHLALPVKYSSYGCTVCTNVTLCISPCFEYFIWKLITEKRVLTTD